MKIWRISKAGHCLIILDAQVLHAALTLCQKEIIDLFAMNLHRIERDVNRCDRHYKFFKYENLDKLQNVLCTYVWKNLHHGYVQGMCDLAAPLLVILKDEALAYGCFDIMMKRLSSNFNTVEQMDSKLSNIKLLLQRVVIDTGLGQFSVAISAPPILAPNIIGFHIQKQN
uniref:Rab-GAP TBC domain-containing protein n=1 Tax=Romanomermis culicivorax TaxID=13658 RepID=A0A915KVU9_ROMCU